MIGHIILRMTIWLLLTADFSWLNILIGLTISVLLPRNVTAPDRLKDWLRSLWLIVKAVPIAYLEAFELLVRPHNHEAIVLEQVPSGRSRPLVFLDIFLITFTPKTIVQNYRENGWYEVHVIRRRPEA